MWYVGEIKKDNKVLSTFFIGSYNYVSAYDFIEQEYMKVYNPDENYTFDFREYSTDNCIKFNTMPEPDFIVHLM